MREGEREREREREKKHKKERQCADEKASLRVLSRKSDDLLTLCLRKPMFLVDFENFIL